MTHARFVGTDPASDEVVLMKILQVLRDQPGPIFKIRFPTLNMYTDHGDYISERITPSINTVTLWTVLQIYLRCFALHNVLTKL